MTDKQKYPPWDTSIVEGVADVLGETYSGLTGTEIGSLLAMCNIHDEIPGATKRFRLRVALHNRQVKDQASGYRHSLHRRGDEPCPLSRQPPRVLTPAG